MVVKLTWLSLNKRMNARENVQPYRAFKHPKGYEHVSK